MSYRLIILISFIIALISAAVFFGILSLFQLGMNWMLNLFVSVVLFIVIFAATLFSLNSLLKKSNH